MQTQLSLFGSGAPVVAQDHRVALAPRRIFLDDTAWLDHTPGFLHGHVALMDTLVDVVTWSEQRRQMFDRVVAVPRLMGRCDDVKIPIIEHVREALSERYQVHFDHLLFALYRDGDDSVAWHGDRGAREAKRSHVVTLSLGSPRRFLLRPLKGHRGARRSFELGWGDLMVMGGSCQRTWEHAISKVSPNKIVGPRLVVMLRASDEWEALDVKLDSSTMPERCTRTFRGHSTSTVSTKLPPSRS